MSHKKLLSLAIAFAFCSGSVLVNVGIAQDAAPLADLDRVFADEEPWVQPAGFDNFAPVANGASCPTCGVDCSCGPNCGCSSGGPAGMAMPPSLTKGLWGKGMELAQQGIMYKGSATQFYQGVGSGGREQTGRYGGKVDQYLILDSGKLGWWKGTQLIMHVETAFGENSIFDATGLSPVNTAFLTPGPNEHVTAITNFQLMHGIGGGWAATVGRINTIDLWAALYPKYGAGLDGFMNTSLMVPLNTIPTVPIVFNAAGALKSGDRGVEAAFILLDPASIPTTSNLSNLFDNGSTILGFGRIFTEFGGLPGSHAIIGSYATGQYTSLDRNGWAFHPVRGVTSAESTGSWMAMYILQQTIWADPCNEKRTVDVLSAWGFSDPDTSPFEWTANISLEAFGPFASRENDRMGVGYFYSGLSNNFKNLVPVLALEDLQGGELYYNAEIKPWFHLTADVQVIQPDLSRRDAVFVLGLRGKVDL